MPPDSRSVSFIFHRDTLEDIKPKDSKDGKPRKNFRRKLQDRFDKEAVKCKNEEKDTSAEKTWHNLSLGQVSNDSRRALRSGADKISKTISSVKLTFCSITQKFKSSTHRRQRLEEQNSPTNSACKQTPQSRSRNILGRTPTKLYSPFGIESPRNAWGIGKENESTPRRIMYKDETPDSKRNRFFRFSKVNGFCALR